jgi:tetratricopeptide (TPR) repeat protein
MSTDVVAPDLFAAGTCGATLVRDLLRTLALKDPDLATAILDRILDHPLIRVGFSEETIPALVADLRGWLGGRDDRFEYQHVKLLLRALQRLRIEPAPEVLEIAMSRAYGVGDERFAESTARALNTAGPDAPATLIVRSHDILGRIHSDHGEFDQAAKCFAAGTKAARTARLDYEEWDQRTNRVWCLFAQDRHREALREIDAAERVARRMNRPDSLAKTLLDRGNSELALERMERAHVAYEGALLAAEAAGNLARQSDALGNLGSIAFSKSDFSTAERFHRRALEISRTLSDPKSAQYDLNNLAQALWKQHRSDEAVKALEEALQIAQQGGDRAKIEPYSRSLRQMYTALGRYATAEGIEKRHAPATGEAHAEDRQEEEEETVQQAHALEGRVRMLLNERDAAGAQQLVEGRLAENPADWRARCLYGVLLSVAGDDAGARAQYTLALESAPDSLDPHYRIADSYAKTRELDDLLIRYERLVADEPFRAGTRLALALIHARLGRPDEAIRQALEAVRLAPNQELLYMALAEGQMSKAHSLLRSNWDGAWLAFQDCSTTLFRLTSSGTSQRGQFCAFAGRVFEQFAMASHFTNPPLSGGMDSGEVQVLAQASHFYRQAQEHDPWRAMDSDVARVLEVICALAKPGEITAAAGYLRLDGWQQEALTLLVLSLQADPEQAETYYQLALFTGDADNEESRKAALEHVRRAVNLDPENPSYRQAERYFEQKPSADAGKTEDNGGE